MEDKSIKVSDDAFKCGETGWDSEVDCITKYAGTDEALRLITEGMEERAVELLYMDEVIIDCLGDAGFASPHVVYSKLIDAYGFEITIKPYKYDSAK